MSTQHHHNPSCMQKVPAERAAHCIENLSGWDSAVREITSWPEYHETPTWDLAGHAQRLGIGKLFYKDESTRFGRDLGSFKALGAPYAVYSLLADRIEDQTGCRPTAADLRSGKFQNCTESIVVCVATDGNQGRGLAYGAKAFGCSLVAAERKEKIERLGAIVIRIKGEYQESVYRAKENASVNGWFFVSSTSWDDFDSVIPRHVMNGYMVIVEEALQAIPDLQAITHVFMCGGFGSIAAAVFMGFMSRCLVVPRFIVIGPSEADCLYQSSISTRPTQSQGSLRTIMAGLACREVSPATYKMLEWLASDFVVVPDQVAINGMKALAEGHGDIPIVCGESSGANMGVLLETTKDSHLRSALGLDPQSQVVIFGCEGVTAPSVYEKLTGRNPDDVYAQWSAHVKRQNKV